MARLQNQKRKRADESSGANVDLPLKKTKARGESKVEGRKSWENPPEFYDRLSKISLTRRALREFNRRTYARRSYPSLPAKPSTSILLRSTPPQDLVRFSRHGGPNLHDLRGYPHPPVNHPHRATMSISRSSRSQGTRSSGPALSLPTSATTKSKKSSPYDRDFDLHLTENLVHPIYSSQEPDLEEITAAIAIQRPSLSPSEFSDNAFKAFREADARVKDEDDVLANVIPTILGPGQADRFCARNTVFNNLEPLTDGTITAPNPDIYWGAYPEQLAQPTRNELAGHITPSTMEDKPIAPNFFMEVKGPNGSLAVAIRQARYVGAIGARAMHSLHNYGIGKPQYDNCPYTFSSIYHGGQLQLYTHHITAPEGGRLEYHMTKLDGFDLTGNRRTFVEGVSALWNLLDLAEKYRNKFIETVNTRASPAETAGTPSVDSADKLAPSRYCTAQIQHGEESTDELALSPTWYVYKGDDLQDSKCRSTSEPRYKLYI